MTNLDELERLAQAATPSNEWKFEERGGEIKLRVRSGYQAFFPLGRPHRSLNDEVRANATFIATANPATVLELIELYRSASEQWGLAGAQAQEMTQVFLDAQDDRDRLAAQNAELVAALERIAKHPLARADEMSAETMRDIARAALAKVKGVPA